LQGWSSSLVSECPCKREQASNGCDHRHLGLPVQGEQRIDHYGERHEEVPAGTQDPEQGRKLGSRHRRDAGFPRFEVDLYEKGKVIEDGGNEGREKYVRIWDLEKLGNQERRCSHDR